MKETRQRRSTRSQQRNKENQPIMSGTAPVSVSSNVATASVEQQNECSVCLGRYEDDFVDGELLNEWICCSNCN